MKIGRIRRLSVLIWVWCTVAAAHAESPRADVEAAVTEVLSIINDTSAERRTKVQQIRSALQSRFDFRTTAQSTLARNWHALSEAERARFVDLFAEVLILTYLDTVESVHFDAAEIRYLKTDYAGPDHASVATQIPIKTYTLAGNQGGRLSISYRLRLDHERWRIYDVIVAGFSVVGTYRTNLRRVIERSGVPGLFETLRAERDGLQRRAQAPHPRHTS